MNITMTQQDENLVLSLTEAGKTLRYEGVRKARAPDHGAGRFVPPYYHVWATEGGRMYAEGSLGSVIDMAAKHHREQQGK